MTDGSSQHLVVLGGGITGLAAAWEAVLRPGLDVTVLEASDRLGGKIRTSTIELPTGGLVVDEGADNFLARVPDAVELCEELGLGEELTEPRVGRARIWIGQELRWFPTRHVLGVPVDVEDLAATRILSEAGLAAAAAEADRTDPGLTEDVSIGGFLADRFGRELVDHVVGPLVGGVNAGDVMELSLRAVTPQLADAAAEGGSLMLTLRRRLEQNPPRGPVFKAVVGGTERLVGTLADAVQARGGTIRTGARATGCRPGPEGRILVEVRDGATAREAISADAVVVALPAPDAAPLLRPLSPECAAGLDRIEHVPVAFGTFAYRRDQVPIPLDASGFLVPRDSGRILTAASWGSAKWAAWDDGSHVILRAAAGHRHDHRHQQMDDRELLAALRSDLTEAMSLRGEPVQTRLTRWSPGFAQYTVGHQDRVAALQQTLSRDAPTVRAVGADLGGLGIPACISQGRGAVRDLLGPHPG